MANRTAPTAAQLAKCGVNYCPFSTETKAEEDQVGLTERKRSMGGPKHKISLEKNCLITHEILYRTFFPLQVSTVPPPTLIEDPSSPLGAEEAAGENENFKTGRTERMILSGVFLACSIVAPIIIALLVDPISKCVEKGGPAQSLHSQKEGSESEPCPLFGIRNGGGRELLWVRSYFFVSFLPPAAIAFLPYFRRKRWCREK